MTVNELIEALQSWKMPDADVKTFLGMDVLEVSPKGGSTLELITDFPYSREEFLKWENDKERLEIEVSDNEWYAERCLNLEDNIRENEMMIGFLLRKLDTIVKEIAGRIGYYPEGIIPKDSIFHSGNINDKIIEKWY